ncbi:MAG TPA: shikimate kinase [Verrucomicrobiae bacterium]|jgi:shikimate kinase|nr:shikimate kinase [Verrucomicrobiae bacterium]
MTGAAPNRRVFLIGFMGAGKTSVGKALARRLGWSFRDLDALIEDREQRKIAAIFTASGEARFREIETAALKELLAASAPGDWVVALGGGTFVQPHNRIALQQAGAITILLEAPLAELMLRCKSDGVARPLARKETAETEETAETRIRQLFESRREAYSLARFRIATSGKSVEKVAEEIEQLLESDVDAVPHLQRVKT